MASFWYRNCVVTFLLNSNVSIGSNIATADAADNSLKKLDSISDRNAEKCVINSLYTDTRGGETREGLAAKMHTLNRILSLYFLLIVTYILYTMNHMMQSLCKKYFRSSSISSPNCI